MPSATRSCRTQAGPRGRGVRSALAKGSTAGCRQLCAGRHMQAGAGCRQRYAGMQGLAGAGSPPHAPATPGRRPPAAHLQRQPAANVLLGDGDHQPHVAVNHVLARLQAQRQAAAQVGAVGGTRRLCPLGLAGGAAVGAAEALRRLYQLLPVLHKPCQPLLLLRCQQLVLSNLAALLLLLLLLLAAPPRTARVDVVVPRALIRFCRARCSAAARLSSSLRRCSSSRARSSSCRQEQEAEQRRVRNAPEEVWAENRQPTALCCPLLACPIQERCWRGRLQAAQAAHAANLRRTRAPHTLASNRPGAPARRPP